MQTRVQTFVGVSMLVALGFLVFFVFILPALAKEVVPADSSPIASSTTKKTVSESTNETRYHDAKEVEARVREFFVNAPVMTEIARCESKFRQYTDSGNVLHGGLGGAMVGVFQINKNVHTTQAKSLGYDISVLEGNLSYANYLYQIAGTNPWVSSLNCWNNSKNGEENVENETDTSALNTDLRFGETHPQVLVLQKLLNGAGYTLADSGPGSSGNETMKFGNLTRAAVRTFQCREIGICDGNEYSTGYGLVGKETRGVLLAYKSTTVPKHMVVSEQSKTTITKGLSLEEQAHLQTQINELLRLIAQLQQLLNLLS